MKNQNFIAREKIFNGRSIPGSVKRGLIIQKWLNLTQELSDEFDAQMKRWKKFSTA